MLMHHPVLPDRCKDVPDALVGKYLAGGWTKAEAKKAPAQKAAARPSDKK